MRYWIRLIAAVMVCVLLALPVSALGPGFETTRGFSTTSIIYYFDDDEAVIVYNKQVDAKYQKKDEVWAGSTLYVPLYSYDTDASDTNPAPATDKQIKEDSVELNYKTVQGERYVEEVALVNVRSGKVKYLQNDKSKDKKSTGSNDKIKNLENGIYARVQFTNDFTVLDKREVQVRLVISVNGVTYQDTAITFICDLQNRIVEIPRNSVYGAITPTQFYAPAYYSGEATFDFGSDIKYTSRVSAGQKYYLNLDRTEDENLTDMYSDAYMEFYNFKGDDNTFSTTGRLDIKINQSKFKQKKTRAELYVYEITGNTLRSLGTDRVSYDSKTQTVSIQTRTLGSYVLSSRALMQSVEKSMNNDILRSGYASSIDEEEESGEAV